MLAATDGSNNPNIPGQDNGLNAWMDANLNQHEVVESLQIDANYAKRNSDQNRCHDIDDIPVRGPPTSATLPMDISVEQATATANMLLNQNNLYICRKTGMLIPKGTHTRQPPSSTVSRVELPTNRPRQTGTGNAHG